MRKKVTVVGGGFVGSTTAQRIVDTGLADVVLTDILEGVPAGKALDMLESTPITGSDSHVQGISTASGDYRDTANSDIVVITAGFPRKPGMSRDDLLKANYDVVKARRGSHREAFAERHSDHGDQSARRHGAGRLQGERLLEESRDRHGRRAGFGAHEHVRGAGTGRLGRKRALVRARRPRRRHGAAAALLDRGGIPLPDLLPKERIDAIVDRTRKGGAEIVNLLKTGSAYYAPSAAVVEMVEAILKDKKKILPCAAYLEGEYGINGLFVGVPVKLGARGVEQIIQIKLTRRRKRRAAKIRRLGARTGHRPRRLAGSCCRNLRSDVAQKRGA